MSKFERIYRLKSSPFADMRRPDHHSRFRPALVHHSHAVRANERIFFDANEARELPAVEKVQETVRNGEYLPGYTAPTPCWKIWDDKGRWE